MTAREALVVLAVAPPVAPVAAQRVLARARSSRRIGGLCAGGPPIAVATLVRGPEVLQDLLPPDERPPTGRLGIDRARAADGQRPVPR